MGGNMPSQMKLDSAFMTMAYTIASLSKDPSRKVGAVLVSADGRKFSVGYNGFPIGVDESPEKWERPMKYEYVQHAELNAITNCPWDITGSTLFVTLQPCHRCLGSIINAGVARVVYAEKYERSEILHKQVWLDLVGSGRIKVTSFNGQLVKTSFVDQVR